MKISGTMVAERNLASLGDKIAVELSKSLNCEGVFVSLANTEQLFSFGMSQVSGSDVSCRIHDATDSVCNVTVSKNKPLELSDARFSRETSRIPYVTSGHIVGYLGQPIRDGLSNAVGAICAISNVPRVWSDKDKLLLRMACLEAEKLLAQAVFEQELYYMSNALSDYDRIVGSAAQNLDLKVSIHSMEGGFLFATNALLAESNPAFLEDQVRHILPSRTQGNVRNFAVAMAQTSKCKSFQRSLDKNRHWKVSIRECSTETLFVHWEIDGFQTVH